VRKLIAAAAILAVVFVIGCQDTKKVTELQGQVDKLTQQVTELTGQLQQMTVAKDSVTKVLTELQAKMPPAKGGTTKPPTNKGGGGTVKPPTKK
jgi:outer membrane murein-binding lipoprotein Lpp